MENSEGKTAGKPEMKPVRSPSYPAMSLRDAVLDVGKIETLYRGSSVDREAAAKVIGYTSLSGPAGKALGALASYGLVESSGKGELRVTQRARAILHPQSPTEKQQSLREAALNPQLFQELQERFPSMKPPMDGIFSHLNRKGYNQSAVKPAARSYLDTLDYLEETGASKNYGFEHRSGQESGLPEQRGGAEDDAPKYGGAQIGDLVQWESQGVLQLEKPLRVRFVSDDGQWIAVEGSETGIPMNEVIVESVASKAALPPPIFKLPEAPSVEVSPQKGEVEWLRNKVGADTSIRLFVTGEMGPKEIGKLIKLLEAQKTVLED